MFLDNLHVSVQLIYDLNVPCDNPL